MKIMTIIHPPMISLILIISSTEAFVWNRAKGSEEDGQSGPMIDHDGKADSEYYHADDDNDDNNYDDYDYNDDWPQKIESLLTHRHYNQSDYHNDHHHHNIEGEVLNEVIIRKPFKSHKI